MNVRTLFLVLVIGAVPAGAQVRGVRFEITQVGDTTFAFPPGRERWIRPGQTGIAVDPRARDALVARFRIVAVDTALVRAVVTGQTTRLVTEHVAILDEPPRPWFRTLLFWGGLFVGAALGVIAGSQI